MRSRIPAALTTALLGLCVLTACSNSNSSLAPFEPEVNNAPGTFQLQATGVDNVTATEEYTWSNSKTT
ncbi:hypothetical protein K8I85_01630, partial [bacterium]|nr:hypothetical protein [bacterium]